MEWSDFLTCVVQPSSSRQLFIFYVAWLSVFLGINLLWDVLSPLTPVFHLHRIRDKVGTLYAASTFCSSLLLLISLFDSGVAKVAGETLLPMIQAGMTGLLHSIGEICPHESTARTRSS
jgi:hypothetical protein